MDERDTILVVDDDEAVLNMLCKVVREDRIVPVSAKSGSDALRLVEEQTFDLILLDVNMPGLDGFPVVQEIRRRGI